MGQLIWTLGIIVLALRINHDEAKAHEPPAANITASDTARTDSVTVYGDTIRIRH